MKNRLAHLLLFVTLLTTACGQLPGDYMLTRKPPTSGALLPKYFTPVTGQYLTFDANLLPVMGTPAADLGSVTGTLAIASGGTGSASASAARTALGLAIGSDVQAYSASTSLLGSSISLTSEVTDTLPVANGGTGAASASAARTALGLAIGSDVQAYSASTSLLGSSISLTSEVTDTLPVANGGTGAASASAARTALGLTIGSDVQAYSASTSLLGSSISLTSEVADTLPVANGGTGGTSAATARSGLLPSYTGNAGKALVVNAGATDVEFATVSGGGGSTLVRGAGVLQGYTVAPVVASAPPNLTYTFAGGPDSEWTASYTYNGTGYSFTAAAADPMNGTVWIDTSAGTWDEATSASALSSAISALGLSGVSTGSGSDWVEVSMALTGAAYSHSGTLDYGAGSAVSGGGSGTDAVPGSGHVSEVTLISQDGTKTIKPLRFGVSGAGVSTTVQFALKVGGTYYPIASDLVSDTTTGEPAVSGWFAEMVSGRASASLVARMTGSVPTGGSLTFWAIAEQN